jgi:hypothetical protein
MTHVARHRLKNAWAGLFYLHYIVRRCKVLLKPPTTHKDKNKTMANTTITKLSAETDTTMLRHAACLVRRGWRCGGLAGDANGNTVSYFSPDAVCFCIAGAINRSVMDGLGGDIRIIYTDLFDETVGRLYDYVVQAICLENPEWQRREAVYPEVKIADWNDDWKREQMDAVDVLEKASTLTF